VLHKSAPTGAKRSPRRAVASSTRLGRLELRHGALRVRAALPGGLHPAVYGPQYKGVAGR